MHIWTPVLLSAVTCVMVGCSTPQRQSSVIPSDQSGWTRLKRLYPTNFITVSPTNFITKISSADHVIVKFRIQDPELQRISLTLTDNEATEVIKAISLLKTERVIPFSIGGSTVINSPDCGCEDKRIEFYGGTNQLGTADFGKDLVYIDFEYQDQTGTLRRVEAELIDKTDR